MGDSKSFNSLLSTFWHTFLDSLNLEDEKVENKSYESQLLSLSFCDLTLNDKGRNSFIQILNDEGVEGVFNFEYYRYQYRFAYLSPQGVIFYFNCGYYGQERNKVWFDSEIHLMQNYYCQTKFRVLDNINVAKVIKICKWIDELYDVAIKGEDELNSEIFKVKQDIERKRAQQEKLHDIFVTSVHLFADLAFKNKNFVNSYYVYDHSHPDSDAEIVVNTIFWGSFSTSVSQEDFHETIPTFPKLIIQLMNLHDGAYCDFTIEPIRLSCDWKTHFAELECDPWNKNDEEGNKLSFDKHFRDILHGDVFIPLKIYVEPKGYDYCLNVFGGDVMLNIRVDDYHLMAFRLPKNDISLFLSRLPEVVEPAKALLQKYPYAFSFTKYGKAA